MGKISMITLTFFVFMSVVYNNLVDMLNQIWETY